VLAHRGVGKSAVAAFVEVEAVAEQKPVKLAKKRKPVMAVATIVVPDSVQPRPVVDGGWKRPSTPAEVEAARLAIERVRAENAVRGAVRVGRVDPPNCGVGAVGWCAGGGPEQGVVS
jgi:hypothetical protein